MVASIALGGAALTTWRKRVRDWARGHSGRAFVLALVIDVFVSGSLYWINADNEFVTFVRDKYLVSTDLAQAIAKVFRADSIAGRAVNWLAGPGVRGVLFVVVLSLLYGFFDKSWLGGWFISHFWPPFPDVLEEELFAPLPGYAGPPRLAGPFLERDEELKALLRFCGDEPTRGAAWMQINGPEGVGKSRLALEALSRLKELGWDVGLLKPAASLLDIERSHFGAKTAVLIETASRPLGRGGGTVHGEICRAQGRALFVGCTLAADKSR